MKGKKKEEGISVQVELAEDDPPAPGKVLDALVELQVKLPPKLEPETLLLLGPITKRGAEKLLTVDLQKKAGLCLWAAHYLSREIEVAVRYWMQERFQKDITVSMRRLVEEYARLSNVCFEVASQLVDFRLLSWMSRQPPLIKQYLDEILALNRTNDLVEDPQDLATKGDAIDFLRDLGLTRFRSERVLESLPAEYIGFRSDTRSSSTAKIDNNEEFGTDTEVLNRILQVLPHFKVALLAAGASEQQASYAIDALREAVTSERFANGGSPMSPELPDADALVGGPQAALDESPSANLQVREQALWDIALDRVTANLAERGRALTSLGHLYRVAAEAAERGDEAPRKRVGRPQEGSDEDLLDIIVNPELEREVRHRAVKALQSRWVRMIEKSRS